MQVQKIQNNKYNTNFQAVQVCKKHFSGKQGQLSSMIIKEMRKVMPNSQNKTLESYYGKQGYDFLVDTYPYYDLVSLSAYKGVKKDKEIPIGIYGSETLSSLCKDIKSKIKSV